MAEEEKTENQGVNADSNAEMSKIQVDKTEFETIQQKAQRMMELEEKAKNDGFDSYEDYQQTLEYYAFENYDKIAKNQDSKMPEKKPETPSQNTQTPQQAAIPEEFLTKLKESDMRATQAYLRSDWVEYQMDVKGNEVESYGGTKDQLTRLITGNDTRDVIVRRAQNKFGGNLYKAANEFYGITEGKALEKAQEKAKAEATATGNAKGTANIGASGGMPTGDGKSKTSGDRMAEYQKKAADEIAPDTIPSN